MAPPSGDSSGNDRNRSPGSDDATRIVPQRDANNQETVILQPGRTPGQRSPDPNGTLIGVSNIQQGARIAGRPVPGGGNAFQQGGGKPGGDNTVFMPVGAAAQAGQGAGTFDPVVGWLVITKGLGRGHFKPVYYGQNSIGRDATQRISIDFGDQRISRDAHAFIIYDETGRKFFLRDNGKSNVVRHKGNLVMMPTELKDRDEIVIGDTTARFIAFCDTEFDWLAQGTNQGAKDEPAKS